MGSSSKYLCPICSIQYCRRSIKNHAADCHYGAFLEQRGSPRIETTESHEAGEKNQLDGQLLLPLMSVLFSGFTQWLQFNPDGQHALADASLLLVPAKTSNTHKIPNDEEL